MPLGPEFCSLQHLDLHPQMDCLYLQSARIVSWSSWIYVWFFSIWAGLCFSISVVLQTVLRFRKCFLRPRGHWDHCGCCYFTVFRHCVMDCKALRLDTAERQCRNDEVPGEASSSPWTALWLPHGARTVMAWEYLEPVLPGEENSHCFYVFSWHTWDSRLMQK